MTVRAKLVAVDRQGRTRVYYVRARPGGVYSTIAGPVRGDDIINALPAGVLESVRGLVYIVEPSWVDLLEGWAERRTQVIYPKDASYIAVRLGLRDGSRVLEAGLGSGFLATVILSHICPNGRLIAYEIRREHLEAALRNVELAGFADCLDARLGDIAEAPGEPESIDALALDLPDPWRVLPRVARLLRRGAPAAVFLPTTSQVDKLLHSLDRRAWLVEAVEELLLRGWEANPGALRPSPRMIGHTGFIIFLRRIGGE